MRITISILGFLFLLPWGTVGMAADFPQKPIRMIIPWSAGGGNDVLCRAFQPAFEKDLGQKILIDNIPAGTTKMGTMELMKAKPDGYTLIFSTTKPGCPIIIPRRYDTKVWEQMVPIGNVTSEPYGVSRGENRIAIQNLGGFGEGGKGKSRKTVLRGPGAGGMMDSS